MSADPSTPASPPGRLLVLPFYDGRRVVVVLSGEADASTEAVLRDRLAATLTSRPLRLVVDARDLTFCDLRGLDALTDVVQVAERSGVTVTVRPSAQLSWLMATLDRLSDQRTVGPGPARPSAPRLPTTDQLTPLSARGAAALRTVRP